MCSIGRMLFWHRFKSGILKRFSMKPQTQNMVTQEKLQLRLFGLSESECVVCEDSTDFPETTHLREHAICHECIKSYLHIKIMKEGAVDIPCPISGCDASLEYGEIQIHVKETEFARYMIYIQDCHLI